MPVFHVLVVDDNPADIGLTVQAIAEAGIPCGITIANNGEAAIERLAEFHQLPDLILMDLNMPGKDGLQLVAELKSSSRTRLIPVVMLSSSTAPLDIQSAYRASANCYIVKPLTFESYVEVISAVSSFWFNIASLPKQPERFTIQ